MKGYTGSGSRLRGARAFSLSARARTSAEINVIGSRLAMMRVPDYGLFAASPPGHTAASNSVGAVLGLG